jgi:hypothetical protein
MRRRFIAWKTNLNNPKPTLELPVRDSKENLWSRNSRCSRAARVEFLLAVLVLALIVGCSVILRLLRYTKENDPYYKNLRFGNVSAVQALYSNLNYTTTSRQDLANTPVVFYNVYIPSTGIPNTRQPRQDTVFDIVKEQLNQVQTIAAQFTTQKDLVVQLITIAPNYANAEKAKDICDSVVGLQCHHLKHAEAADEMFALDALYQYCVANPLAKVTYLHSKGSFHDNKVNDAWRRALTAAALHPGCWGIKICDVCGLQFFTQFTLFWPGNMWTASCHYVKNLIPPKTFTQRQEEAVADMLLFRLDGVLQSQLLRDRSDYFGLDRYAAEHWIGSHPDLQPCDMDPSERPQDIFKRNAPLSSVADAFQFGLAPRHVGFAVGHNFDAHERLHESDVERKKEIYLLPGRLFLWYKLYKRVPSLKSWAWKWFPDGSFWESQIDALDRGPVEGGSLASIFHSAISSNDIDQIFWRPGLDALFCFIIIGDHFGVQQAMDQLEMLQQDTGRERTVILTIFHSSGVAEFSSLCGSLWTECHVRDTMNIAVALLESANRIAQFCENQKERSVLFRLNEYTCPTNVKSRSSFHDGATDISCSHQSCTPLGFTAQCSFVRQLMNPRSFLRGVEAAVKLVLLADVRNERRRKPTLGIMAVEQFLLYAWIAIHPMTVPCDICNKLLLSVSASDRDRDLILAILLVVEVFYENRGVLSPPCAQQWKSHLRISSSISQYLNISSLEGLSQRIYQP